MNSIDFTPLYRSTIGFDRLPSLLDKALRSDTTSNYPPYDIEMVSENKYALSLAVAGFKRNELDIQVEKGVLTVHGHKAQDEGNKREYLYQGIATRSFERKFNLADHVEVTGADLQDGLLTIQLVKELPEEMKPRTIPINTEGSQQLEHKTSDSKKVA
ncbi:Hsp20 family protein [Bowmanella dokdonensis]|uniref:Hsp20 family protein n=1 Tax=Bowmanella dokdonensis TaxID=751969 RepID=A0A939IR48_9ALTE|nr:Hsp20 family protein [Bowmanella dokdonensis]MBN7827595.1 Hsp20 family protein [Bowmanella dokdonensis]